MRKIICILPLLMSLLLACDLLSGVYDERWLIDYTSPNIGTLKYVPPGSFQRDGTSTNISTISTAFYMSQYEITQAQYMAVMGVANPSGFPVDTSRPVEQVNWYSTLVFCNKLSMLEGLTPVYTISSSTNPSDWGAVPGSDNSTWNAVIANWDANGYRLPTDMERMWAAMGATIDGRTDDIVNGINTSGYTKGYSGSTESGGAQVNIGNYAWYNLNSGAITHSVGTMFPNELGIYDLSGNVWDWCWDQWDGSTGYPAGQLTDYRGGSFNTYQVIRGGAYDTVPSSASVSSRYRYQHWLGTTSLGFRVVRQ